MAGIYVKMPRTFEECGPKLVHPPLEITKIEQMVAPEMAGLEREMHRVLGTDHPFLRELAERIMEVPGKRLRPKLLVLCSKMLGYAGSKAATYAAVFELVHTATLIHDDIIDDAKTRRGKQTLNQDLGNTVTVLYGDLLYTKAHTLAIEAGRLDVLATIDWVSERMIEGELLQARYCFRNDITEEIYFDILKRKTAYLFAGTTKTAGMIAGCDEATCEALYEFGFNFGISFQLMDDYLDYVSTASEMGKPVLSDLKEGKVTLPVIRMLANDDGSVKAMIQELWDEPGAEVSLELGSILKDDANLRDTWMLAESYAKRAVEHLAGFEKNEYHTILSELPFFSLHRRK